MPNPPPPPPPHHPSHALAPDVLRTPNAWTFSAKNTKGKISNFLITFGIFLNSKVPLNAKIICTLSKISKKKGHIYTRISSKIFNVQQDRDNRLTDNDLLKGELKGTKFPPYEDIKAMIGAALGENEYTPFIQASAAQLSYDACCPWGQCWC